MKEGEVKRRKKLQKGKVTIKRRSHILEKRYIKEGEGTTTRSTKRKREKSEDNSERVVVLLIKMKLIEGE